MIIEIREGILCVHNKKVNQHGIGNTAEHAQTNLLF